MKTFFAIIIYALTSHAQSNNDETITRRLPTVEINGQNYFEARTPDNDQVLIKEKTERSPPVEAEPTVANEYQRLGIFSVEVGIGWQNFSKKNWTYTKDGQSGEVGSLEGGRETQYSLPYGAGFDLGGSFRPPTAGFLNRASIGAVTTILIAECHKGTDTSIENPDKTSKRTLISIPKYAFSSQCPNKFTDIFTRNWTAYADYDVLIFRGGTSTKAITAGVFREAGGADHYVGSTELGFQRTYQTGGLIRFRKLGTEVHDQRRGSVVGHDWVLSAFIGGQGNFRITISRAGSLTRKRVNPPIKVEK